MATTKINGSEQIKANSVSSGQVDTSIIVAGGGNAFSGDQSMGSHKLTNLANGASANDAVNLAQVQSLISTGQSTKLSVQAMTTGGESYTISAGSVTQIAGTTVDGVTLAVGDRVLIKNAPASTGSGTADSSNAGTDQPTNGIYTVTANTTNLSVSRDSTSATPLSGSVHPAGAVVWAEAGTANKGAGYEVMDPANPDSAFTYGTTNMQWGKINAGAGSVTTVSVTSANGFAGSVTNASTTPGISISTTVTGVLKGNGTAVSAAAAGTDYLAPSNWVANETPTGTINGSNTSFTLANTPNSNVTNPVMLYLNGVLLEPGSGNDFTISGTTITALTAPATGDKLRAYYWK